MHPRCQHKAAEPNDRPAHPPSKSTLHTALPALFDRFSCQHLGHWVTATVPNLMLSPGSIWLQKTCSFLHDVQTKLMRSRHPSFRFRFAGLTGRYCARVDESNLMKWSVGSCLTGRTPVIATNPAATQSLELRTLPDGPPVTGPRC